MTPQSVTCPQCQTALRSRRPLSPTEMMRCPQCGNHFLATAAVPASLRSRSFALLVIPAAFAAAVLGLGTVLGVYLWIQPPKPAVPVVDQERERRFAEKEKKLAEAQAKLDEDTRRQRFTKLLDEGKKYLDEKKFTEAQSTLEGALKLYPSDSDALNALIAAKTGKVVAKADAQLTEDKEKRKADFDKLMDQGKQALAAKQYALACTLFESAVKLLPGEDTALKALADAKAELAKDDGEKKKLADYRTFLDAGKAALAANRPADAFREFLGAQRILPGDAVALKGQQDAEKQLAALKDADKKLAEYNTLMDRAKTALSAKRYADALDGATAALRLMPNDLDATNLVNDAKKGRRDASAEFNRVLAAAQAARAAQRYEEAQRLYAKALEILPNDPVALKAQQDFLSVLADLQAGQAAYNRFMAAAQQALAANRYADAVQGYTEALRVVPNDLDAQKGLATAQGLLNVAAQVQTNYNGFMTLGAAALSKKLYRDAEAAYRDALKTIPNDPLALAGLRQAKYLHNLMEGDKALLLKKYSEAIKFFKEALEANPGDQPALEQLRTARYQHGIQDGTAALLAKKYADAVALLEEALREKPNDLNAKELLHQAKYARAFAEGQAALRLQRGDEAAGFFLEALKEKPNDVAAMRALEQAKKLKKP